MLWRVQIKESSRMICDNYILQPDGREAALRSLVHFYDLPGAISYTEYVLRYGITGEVLRIHQMINLEVSLHQEHLRRGASHLGNLHSYDGGELGELLKQAEGIRDRCRLHRYIGTIWSYPSPRSDYPDEYADKLLMTSGCFASDRRSAWELISHDYVGRHFGDRNWRIGVFEHSAMEEQSGSLISQAVSAELFARGDDDGDIDEDIE